MEKKKLMVSAGEVSGDQHAARLLRGMGEAARGRLEVFGIGGDAMRSAGVDTRVGDAREMAVVGFWEVLKRLPTLWRIWRRALRALDEEKPDALLLVDYPGFNLRLAAAAKKRGIRVIYYISPQVWAWNRGRIPKMARIVDLLMVIFPFETEVFAGTGLRTEFVGHPLAESVARTLSSPAAEMPWPEGEGGKVALLPGSRRMEIDRIFPAMLDAAVELRRRRPGTRFLVAAAGEETERMVRAALASRGNPEWVGVATGAMRDVVRTADAAMVCSGTATVETGLLGCPMIVVYRTAGLTYWLGKKLIRVKWLGMVNLISGKTLCPEFIQGDAEAGAMADAVESLLGDTPERRAQVEGLAEVRRALSGAGVAGPGTLVARELGVEEGNSAQNRLALPNG